MSRDRLTITLDEDLLTAVDSTIDGSSVRNRSHAIEHLIRQGLHLHELTYVVLAPNGPSDAALLPNLVQRLAVTSIIHSVIISDPAQPQWAQELALSLATLVPKLTTSIIPGDFGNAAALTLVAQELTQPFLLIQFGQQTELPDSFFPLYTEHRHSDKAVTQLLCSQTGISFEPAGCSIVSPELINYIPAGRATLADVFPLLAKAGRVGTYVD